ncbi:MAG: thioredoxin domain-containing protein [candidate division Zixibacteria bacterium]|nr:thioredoxin domain-containing protein [candidate division Zixibacteria bacterium]
MKKLTVLLVLMGILAGCESSASGKSERSTVNQNHSESKFTNHLIDENSPYLLSHAHNPVNWYPWSDEALELAKTEDKPIFLSIGYAACHWCHVMEEESFENEAIAQLLNENFVSIKVDREQRPDLDQIYMAATVTINGSGGWPMSVFLTPDLKPFYAGTYFPPEDRYGRPGFGTLITKLSEAFKSDRDNINNYAKSLAERLSSGQGQTTGRTELDKSIIEKSAKLLMRNYDNENGGFGGAPKFPHASELSFLLKVYSKNGDKSLLNAIEHSLQSMGQGGIYDQIGGGFHRYATDAKWLVPHFEKMLYDNGMLTMTYSDAYKITHNESYKKIVEETLDFLIREMQDETGGFYSSLDADSDGEEGIYYVWEKSQIEKLLGEDSETFFQYYNITNSGNFENRTNIPNITSASQNYKKQSASNDKEYETLINKQKNVLFKERQKRNRPITDDKILTSWNGLAISGLSKGYQITGNDKYRQAALQAASFIKNNLYEDNKLYHSYRLGKKTEKQFLEDHAYLMQGLINLYEISYDYEWIKFAKKLADNAITLFADESGNLFLSPKEQDDLFMRPKDISDGALPAPGSILIQSMVKLADITGDKGLEKSIDKYIAALSSNMNQMPSGMISAISAYNDLVSDKVEIIMVGKDNRDKYLDIIYNTYISNSVLVVSDKGEENIGLLEGRQSNGETVVYMCKNFSCNLPANTVEELQKQLDEL